MEALTDEDLRHQILIFLKEFKELMDLCNYGVKEHLKNLHTLIGLGITTRIRDEIILSISLEDFSSGPTPDAYHPGNYWVFGKDLDSIEIYIKLKIVTDNHGNDFAVCMSFHPSEYPMKYPLRR